ncbi:ABC transporter substrate-binding protein [Micromonospora sp. NBC_01813]|uniref:ABC transporter substrate-binding protein n=1 Tax=Micromonospora sp. NBC_01813 TaxID=2975988 RepID=UPI002DD7A34F|nr:ABC transporter substrate-binding protein [Micromonospora sp. NBC_01813]WSA07625.1 ABC transporter substrate-binding protein [Micromonospora sp. NBC_01813]
MPNIDRRQALKLLAALGVTGLASACSIGTEDDPDTGDDLVSDVPIRIGLIVPQTGGYKPIGDEMLNGFQLYLDNNQRRLGGRPVDLVIADEGETPQSGQAAVDSLLQQNVLALTGVANAAVMLAIRDAVEQAQVPLIGSNASPRSLQSVVYIWRTSYVSDEPGVALGGYLAQEISSNGEVAIVAADQPAGRDLVQGFREGFGAGDDRISAPIIWADSTPNPGRDTFADPIEELIGRDPEAVYCFFTGSAAVAFIRQLRDAGYDGPIYGPGFLTEGTVVDELGEEASGIITALNYSADLDNSANLLFASGYRKRYGASPTTYAMASYDAAQVLDKAIRTAGAGVNAQQLNLALGRIGQIDSPRGSWQFNQPRTPQQKWYLREVLRDGPVLSNVLITELATLG